MLKTSADLDRFMAKVDVTDSCWNWISGKSPHGYGQWRLRGQSVRCHRWIYEQLIGPIPDGLVIDHLCRNTSCVNPSHLEPVTQRENTLRGISPAAQNARMTHCQHGHEFTPENTYVRPNKYGRICRTCARAAGRIRKASKD